MGGGGLVPLGPILFKGQLYKSFETATFSLTIDKTNANFKMLRLVMFLTLITIYHY